MSARDCDNYALYCQKHPAIQFYDKRQRGHIEVVELKCVSIQRRIRRTAPVKLGHLDHSSSPEDAVMDRALTNLMDVSAAKLLVRLSMEYGKLDSGRHWLRPSSQGIERLQVGLETTPRISIHVVRREQLMPGEQ